MDVTLRSPLSLMRMYSMTSHSTIFLDYQEGLFDRTHVNLFQILVDYSYAGFGVVTLCVGDSGKLVASEAK